MNFIVFQLTFKDITENRGTWSWNRQGQLYAENSFYDLANFLIVVRNSFSQDLPNCDAITTITFPKPDLSREFQEMFASHAKTKRKVAHFCKIAMGDGSLK